MVTCCFFLLGLLSDWLFARPAANMLAVVEEPDAAAGVEGSGTIIEQAPVLMEGASGFQFWLLQRAHDVVPNFQVFWLADAVNQEHDIPLAYILSTLSYGLLLIVAAVSLAVILFQKREVG